MAEDHHTEEHHGPSFNTYMVIGGALAVFTAASFVANYMAREGTITVVQSFLIILGVAVVKAALVGIYFMHLKYDWGRLYFMIVPAFILGAMMMFVLMPDIVLGWQHDPFSEDAPEKPWKYLEKPVSTSGTR